MAHNVFWLCASAGNRSRMPISPRMLNSSTKAQIKYVCLHCAKPVLYAVDTFIFHNFKIKYINNMLMNKKLSKLEKSKMIINILNENYQSLKSIQQQTKPQLSVGEISMLLNNKLGNKIDCSSQETGKQEWQSVQLFKLKNMLKNE
jgi:hypothetical protein